MAPPRRRMCERPLGTSVAPTLPPDTSSKRAIWPDTHRPTSAAHGQHWRGSVNEALTDVLQFQAWEDWKVSHPGHPAARFPPPGSTRQLTAKPRALALLVPLSGPLGGVGQAVRDGFSAALLHAEAAVRNDARSNPTDHRAPLRHQQHGSNRCLPACRYGRGRTRDRPVAKSPPWRKWLQFLRPCRCSP